MLELFEQYQKAIFLGIVEGLTEFLPVSSTGHLILFGDVIAYHGPAAETFEIFIQLGAILAVVVLYPHRFTGLLNFSSPLEEGRFDGRSGLLKLFIACIPAFVLGFLLHGYIKSLLFFPFPVALALLFGGLALIFIEREAVSTKEVTIESITYKQCFLIGLFQTLALWPGLSRSGATIVGGMLVGLPKTVAAEFSFLVAVPVMCAATAYDLLKSYQHFGNGAWGELAVGFVVSFIVALIAIRTFVGLLQRYSLAPFGYYRIVLAGLVFWLL